MDIKYDYKVDKKVVKTADLNNGFFDQLKNKRQIRPGSVREILALLRSGKHFGTPIHVNKKDGSNFVIDGNHRLEAIKRFLAEDPRNTVEVTLFIYEDLTDDEEKDIFSTVNKGNKQNTNDVVKQYEDDIKIIKYFYHGWPNGGGALKKFPIDVTIYPQPNSISFYRLVGAYLACKSSTWSGGYVGTPWDFVEEAQTLTLQDVKEMSAFMEDFLMSFGSVVKNNEWMRGTCLTAVMKLWVDNKARIPQDKMIKLFNKKLYKDQAALDMGRSGGAGATVSAHLFYRTLLNGSQKKHRFV